MLRCDNLWWIWSSFLSINFTLLILSWFLTSFFSRGTRSRFSTLAMNFVVMAYLSDKVRPILRLKLNCLSNKKNRTSLDWIWIFGILILSDLGKLHCAFIISLRSVRLWVVSFTSFIQPRLAAADSRRLLRQRSQPRRQVCIENRDHV